LSNGSGSATLLSDNSAKGKVVFSFCVTGITHATLAYAPGSNAETCASN
jgi:hypothetical protein